MVSLVAIFSGVGVIFGLGCSGFQVVLSLYSRIFPGDMDMLRLELVIVTDPYIAVRGMDSYLVSWVFGDCLYGGSSYFLFSRV